jgi:hypothetical protein
MSLRLTLIALAGLMAAALPATSSQAQEDLRERLRILHAECQAGSKVSCIRFGIIMGKNYEKQAEWRREHPEWFYWEH